MRYVKYSEKIKEDLKLTFLQVNNRKPSEIELRFLLCNLWLLAKGDFIDIGFLPIEEEEKLWRPEVTDEEIDAFLLSYENKLKTDYKKEIELLKELVKKRQKQYIKNRLI